MSSFSGLGIGLSFVFGCILMGLVAELYYLLWVRKRIPKSETEDEYNNNKTYATELLHLFCWNNKPNSVNNVVSSQHQEMNGEEDQDLESGNSKNLLLKGYGEDSVESELMRLHNLCGPPRFLFTIKEETKEDLESEDGKSTRNRSFSDLILTPLASSPVKCQNLDSYNCQGFNPLFESNELNRLRSSPPPKFKFLRDAEEKLTRRLLEEEAEKRVINNKVCFQDSIEEKGSFISFLGKSKMREPLQQLQLHHNNSTTCVKVLPLASSPSTYKPVGNESAHALV